MLFSLKICLMRFLIEPFLDFFIPESLFNYVLIGAKL